MRRLGRLATVLAAAALAVTPALGTPAATATPPVTKVKLHGVDLDTATVLDLQDHMNKHRFTSAQLTSFYLSRIQQLNPELHAVIETNNATATTPARSFLCLFKNILSRLITTLLKQS